MSSVRDGEVLTKGELLEIQLERGRGVVAISESHEGLSGSWCGSRWPRDAKVNRFNAVGIIAKDRQMTSAVPAYVAQNRPVMPAESAACRANVGA